MMKTLYFNEEIEPLKKKLKSSIIKASLSFGIAILLCGISLFFAKEETDKLFKFLDSIVAIIGGWVALGYIFLSILKLRKRISLINTILINPKKEYEGEIVDIQGPITLASGYNAYDVKISESKIKHSFYYDIEVEDFDFEVGDKIKFEIGAQNFVYSYEILEKVVKQNENEEVEVNDNGSK